jgi:hypothetical protein
MAEGTNVFLREIDELLGDEVSETDEKDVRQLDDAREPEDELKAALAAHEEVDVLQKLCEGRKVPGDLRLALWKECLGVSRQPDDGQLEWSSGLRGARRHP